MTSTSAAPAELDSSSTDNRRLDAATVLTRFEPWLQKTARGIAGSSSPHLEDLIQEGRVALWNALETYDPSRGALPFWLVSKARYRMYEVVQGKPWTGQPPRLHGRRGIKEPEHVASLDVPVGREYGTGAGIHGNEPLSSQVPPPRDAPDAIDTADLAYHEDELRAALARLTPAQRRYVVARFWEGMTTAEMKDEVFGYDPSALWNSKSNGAKRKLHQSLAHLEGLTS